MKKLSEKQKLRHLRRGRRRKKSKAQSLVSHQTVPFSHKPITLYPPADFSLATNHSGVVSFLNKLKRNASVDGKRVIVRLSRIKRVQPAAAIILSAELDRWKDQNNVELSVMGRATREYGTVLYILENMGLFRVVPPCDGIVPPTSASTSIKVVKIYRGETAIQADAREFRQAIEAYTGRLSQSMEMFDGLSEATTNVVHHAYPDDHVYRYALPNKCWWMGGAYRDEDKTLNIIVYDQGVGIHRTIEKWDLWDNLASWLRLKKVKRDDHASLIIGAMEVGRSSTRQSNRGKGLSNMQDLITASPGGQMRIISGKGEVIAGKRLETQGMNHKLELGGTLIEWQIRLE